MNIDYYFSSDESSISQDSQEAKQTQDQIEIMDDLDEIFIQQGNNQQEEEQEQEYNIPQDEQFQSADFEIRDYQIDLFQKSKEQNSIIFLETGRGKTHIALMHIYYYIKKNGFQNTKLVFLANTIQLVEQQCELIRDQIFSVAQEMEKRGLAPQDNQFDLQQFKDKAFQRKFIVPIHSKSVLANDEEMDIQGWKKERWDDIINESGVLIMMGQMLLNALRRGYLKLPYFSLIIFDECHHCTQRHSYRLIIKEFLECEKVKKQIKHSEKVKFLGLTATPVTSVDIERAVKLSSVPSLQIEVDILQLALNLQSKYVYAKEKQVKNCESKVITYNQELGISTTYIPNHQQLNDFFRLWLEIYFEKEKDKISYIVKADKILFD